MDSAAIKGWFAVEGQQGDRTLEQQMLGLQALRDLVNGKSVLDVGCAEGLIALECARHGATDVHGIDILPRHISMAWSLAKQRGATVCDFQIADAATYRPQRDYNIVLMLSVLHKLSDPLAACRRVVSRARDWAVIRLPPKAARDGRLINIDRIMARAGLRLAHVKYGTFNEWIGWYRRVEAR